MNEGIEIYYCVTITSWKILFDWYFRNWNVSLSLSLSIYIYINFIIVISFLLRETNYLVRANLIKKYSENYSCHHCYHSINLSVHRIYLRNFFFFLVRYTYACTRATSFETKLFIVSPISLRQFARRESNYIACPVRTWLTNLYV